MLHKQGIMTVDITCQTREIHKISLKKTYYFFILGMLMLKPLLKQICVKPNDAFSNCMTV